MINRISGTLAISTAVFFLSCSSVKELVKENFKKPGVDFAGAKLDHLSFEDIGMRFDINVTNPNPIGVKLTGFDFDFLLNERSFVQGKNDAGVEIPANGSHVVPVLVSMEFDKVYQTFAGLRNQDSTRYQINAAVSFDLPFLGPQRIPVSKSGSVPLIKIPNIGVQSLRVERLNLTGADLALRIKLDNPNSFSLLLNQLNYGLEINGSQWLDGASNLSQSVGAKNESILTLPISLNFLQIGQSAAQLLRGESVVNYRFHGSANVGTSLPLIGKTTLPFDQFGEIRIAR
jgi:LEA14-like dessication related protein